MEDVEEQRLEEGGIGPHGFEVEDLETLDRQRVLQVVEEGCVASPVDPFMQTTCERAREEVRRALQSLAPPAQVVLVLRYQQRLSYEEIAAVIDKPVTTVTNRLFEARRQLGRALRQTGEGGNDAYELVGS